MYVKFPFIVNSEIQLIAIISWLSNMTLLG